MKPTSSLHTHSKIIASSQKRWALAVVGSIGLGLSACSAIQDQEFECVGFDEQRTVANGSQQVLSSHRVPQSIDFHVRTDYVLVKSFRAPRSPEQAGQDDQLRFKLQAPKAQIEGNFDPSTGMLSYNESHETSIDGQTQTTSSTGVYRCQRR